MKNLTKRQLAVIDDLFSSAGDEAAVLERHNISLNVFRKWLAEAKFTDEIAFRAESALRQSRLIIARYAQGGDCPQGVSRYNLTAAEVRGR